jgi:hypothetical protein
MENVYARLLIPEPAATKSQIDQKSCDQIRAAPYEHRRCCTIPGTTYYFFKGLVNVP